MLLFVCCCCCCCCFFFWRGDVNTAKYLGREYNHEYITSVNLVFQLRPCLCANINVKNSRYFLNEPALIHDVIQRVAAPAFQLLTHKHYRCFATLNGVLNLTASYYVCIKQNDFTYLSQNFTTRTIAVLKMTCTNGNTSFSKNSRGGFQEKQRRRLKKCSPEKKV